ncbi:MAG: hypothetical protein BHW64_00720 [Candidatus Melainabacteria bacterium LEY3_CP_29_8]|nr:MAG: hypothetical protein BHW64_00720 [Candidatus Melainabacteria bacterium LEY3_CP_29_8]
MLTVLCLILTNKLWLVFKPLSVNFDFEGNGKYNIEVQLNKKDNNEFKKIKSDNKKFVINNGEKLNFEIKRAKYPKRIKFIFISENDKETFKISNINIQNIEYKIDNFEASGANLKIINNKLIIYPLSNESELIYKNKLNIKPLIKFEFEIFIIILVVSFLFFFKIVDYIANFKTIKQASRLDILFLTSFFIILFIPMSHINKNDISLQENRTLAKWNGFIKPNGEINLKFGEDFNNWYNDRFNLREKTININQKIKQSFEPYLYCTQYACWNKRTNWMYWPSRFTQYNLYDQDTYIYSLKKLKEFSQNNKIDLYVMVVPTKCSIYHKEINSSLTPTNEPQAVKELIKAVEDNTKINFIYPYDTFKNNMDKDLLYYKADHHWTQKGSFIGYNLLMNKMKEKYPNIKATKENDYNISYDNHKTADNSQYNVLKLNNEKVFDVGYQTYSYKDYASRTSSNIILSKNYSLLKYHYTYKNALNKQRVMLVGDSFGLNLTTFLSYTFKETVELFARTPNGHEYENFNMKRFENEITKYKPDILIICLSESGINRLNYLYRKDYNKEKEQ